MFETLIEFLKFFSKNSILDKKKQKKTTDKKKSTKKKTQVESKSISALTPYPIQLQAIVFSFIYDLQRK